MQEDPLKRSSIKNITKTLVAFKAARLSLGLNRRQAAERCSCSIRALEQLENGRCNYTEDRLKRLIENMGMTWPEFLRFKDSPEKALAQIDAYNQERTLSRKPRRNLYKLVTKEVRAIRVLRKRRNISQYKASEICGFKECAFGLIEAGRTDLTENKIDLILRSLGYKRQDFDKIVRADIIADEVISEINSLLELLDDQALHTILTMIKTLTKR
ncbi:MAG: helix-turn-helix transcriptional regulator [Bdellovibrionaceae bacterium]|nr:helix-turn-helix transcriptional regulator [Pseudobdellovibrionaceae bacterium]